MFQNVEPCEPSILWKNPHLHTIAGYLKPSQRLNTQGKSFLIDLSDGDKLSCVFYEGTKSQIVYLFHGLAGSTDSGYMHRIAIELLKREFSVVLVNHRGCGHGSGLAKFPYHSGRAEDLSSVISWGKKTFPNFKHIAIGFSLSGNALLLLSAGVRGNCPPDLSFVVCPPLDLKKSAYLLTRGFNKIYDFKFYRQARKDAKTMDLLAERNFELPLVSSIYDFDKNFTAKRGNFESREHYYETCSSMSYFKKIQIPTFVLAAKDDPFVPYQSFIDASKNPQVHLHIEEFGGHMGFLNKTKLPLVNSTRWLDYALVSQLK